MVHKKMGNILQAAEMADPLPGLGSKSYHRVDEGTRMVDAWDRAINGLERSQSYVTHSAGF